MFVSLHTSPTASPGSADAGGMNVVVLNTALALGRAGHRVDLLTRRDAYEVAPVSDVGPGVRQFALDVGPARNVAKSQQEQFIAPFSAAMTTWWNQYGTGVDVVHSHHWFSGVAALPVARAHGVPHVQSFHSVAAPQEAGLSAGEPPESPGRIGGERLVAQESDLILAVSDAEAATIMQRYSPEASKLRVVRPGVDLQQFHPLDPGERSWEWEGCYLLFAARLQPLKGPDLAIRTLAAMSAGERPKLVIAGAASADFRGYVAELRALVHELDLEREVLYLGSQDRFELARMMRGACVVLNPSYSETYGLINLEAAASGVPVVATKAGGMLESVLDGQTGILLDSRDPTRWAQAVRQFTSSAFKRAEFGRAARRFAEQRSWDNVAAEAVVNYELVVAATTRKAKTAMNNLISALQTDPGALRGVRALLVHAHPDDETLQTGVLIAELVANGASVDLVTATRGERGEVVAGVLPDNITADDLIRARRAELSDACKVLGIRRQFMLGSAPARADGLAEREYADSGMRWISDGVAGPAEHPNPDSLSLAPRAAAVADLLALIKATDPTVLVSYDAGGSYGHPDHVRVHEIVADAAMAAGLPRYEIASNPGQPGFSYFDLSRRSDKLVAALQVYRTQLSVGDGYLTHVGGQRQELPTTIGLRLVSPPTQASQPQAD